MSLLHNVMAQYIAAYLVAAIYVSVPIIVKAPKSQINGPPISSMLCWVVSQIKTPVKSIAGIRPKIKKIYVNCFFIVLKP